MQPCYLTFDLGTTALKTALIADDGRPLAVHVEEYTLHSPRPGWAEMAPARYWEAAVTGARHVLAQADAAAVTAIGFSSQGQTFVPLDATGTPLYPAIVWMDNRAQSIADAWEREWLSRDAYARSSGYRWIPGSLTLFKIAWLAEHVPAAHRARQFLCLPDYLIYRLTGETATDYVTARMGGMYDQEQGAWSPRLLAAAGITEAQLPRVLAPGSVAGVLHQDGATALGLPAGIPVCVGANDQLAGAIGAGNVQPGIATETTGTALALIISTRRDIPDPRVVMGRHAVPDLGYAMTFANASAIVLTWFRDLCAAGEGYAALLEGVEAVPPGSDGVTVLPHFAGTLTHPDARGAIMGLALGHSRAHLTRAIMEACACLSRECLEALAAPEAITMVRAFGGAARSDLWLQMKADMLALPVERPACAEAASLGAAMLAATGTGRFSTLAEAAQAWYRADRQFLPDPARAEAYREVYRRYTTLNLQLYPVKG